MSDTPEIFETSELNIWNKTAQEITGFFRDLVIILLIVLFIRMFVMTPFRINGDSMRESYHDKEYILVDKFSYLNLPISYGYSGTGGGIITDMESAILSKIPVHVGDPTRGDVVVITPHVDPDREYFIKRIIGLPGDTIKFENGNVFIKQANMVSGEFIMLNESYLSTSNNGNTRLPESIEQNVFKIPENYYWVMGDNRNNSADSRSCFRSRDGCLWRDETSHFIHRKDILGNVLLDFGYFNIFDKWGLIQSGKLSWTFAPRLLNNPRTASYPELAGK